MGLRLFLTLLTDGRCFVIDEGVRKHDGAIDIDNKMDLKDDAREIRRRWRQERENEVEGDGAGWIGAGGIGAEAGSSSQDFPQAEK